MKRLSTLMLMLLLACSPAFGDVEGRVSGTDENGSITVEFGAEAGVKTRDVFVIVQDGKTLGECMVISIKKSQATLIPKANFKGTTHKGDLARFVRHAEAPAGGYTSVDENEKKALDRVRMSKAYGNSTRATRELGFALGHVPFMDTPSAGAILTGFHITINSSAPNGRVLSMQPLFLTPEGSLNGTVRGKPGEVSRHLEARRGYAVGSVTVHSSLQVDGVKITFMRIDNGALNPRDSYSTDWIGTEGTEKDATIGDGSLVVGIFGRDDGKSSNRVIALGLVTLPNGGTSTPQTNSTSKPTPSPRATTPAPLPSAPMPRRYR